MQEKLSAQGQRIYGSLTSVRKDIVLIGAHKSYQVSYRGRSLDTSGLLTGRPEIRWNIWRLTYNI